jgi:hypothetical protein
MAEACSIARLRELAWTPDWRIRDETCMAALRCMLSQQKREPFAANFGDHAAARLLSATECRRRRAPRTGPRTSPRDRAGGFPALASVRLMSRRLGDGQTTCWTDSQESVGCGGSYEHATAAEPEQLARKRPDAREPATPRTPAPPNHRCAAAWQPPLTGSECSRPK